MTKNEIINNKNHIIRLLNCGRLYDAFAQLRYLSESVMVWEITDEIDQLVKSYQMMLNYAIQGVDDPARESFCKGIVCRMHELLDRVVRCRLLTEESTLYYSTLRFEQMHPNDSLLKLIDAYNEVVDKTSIYNLITSQSGTQSSTETKKEKEQLEKRIFNRIWTTFPLNSEDEGVLNKVLASNAQSQNFQELLVSALLMGAIEFYDSRRLKLLLNAYANENQYVSVKALIAILLIMYRYNQRIVDDEKLINQINAVKELETWGRDVKTAYLELIRTRDTERISKKMQNELIPEMLKLRPDISKKFNDSTEIIDISSLEENPEWEELLNKSGITDKIKELSQLQEEGSDVFMSTFSHLKSFPFFSDIANWFLPFSLDHSLVSDTLGSDISVVGDLIENAPYLCNSDKYSFLLSMGSIPQSQRQLMLSQFEQQRQAINDAGLSMSALTMPNQRQNMMNKYLQDLYRFFKLFRRKGEFMDPFAAPINLINVPLLSNDLDDIETLTLVAEFYFKRKYYIEALDVYLSLSEKMPPSAPIFQKIGYCYQQNGNIENALQNYEHAELLNAESLWTLRRIAACHRTLGHTQKALEYYKRVENSKSDDLNIALNMGHCYLELGNYEEAIKCYYKVEFLDEKSNRAWRPLAWCLLLSKNFSQSKNYYDKILNDNPTFEDFLNMGHLALVQGQIQDAINYYKKSINYNKSEIEKLLHSLKEDEKHLLEIGINVSMIPYIIDALLYSID